jgi:cytochrome c oxidase assembly factor CtaG
LESWSLPITLSVILAATAFFYARGYFRLQKTSLGLISLSQVAAFAGGILSVWIAIGSPLATLDHQLLSAHMVQHILLMGVAAPLLLLGEPALALLNGMPKNFVRSLLAPCLDSNPIRRVGKFMTQPVFCWIAATATVIGWHVPALLELTLHSHCWHEIQETSFLVAGLLFWWPVVEPWPSPARWPRWSIPLYLFFATLPCDALSAFLAFCDRVVYRSYESGHHYLGISPLQDQEWAGVLMWVCVTFIYMVPAVVITFSVLSPLKTYDFKRQLSAQAVQKHAIETTQIEAI